MIASKVFLNLDHPRDHSIVSVCLLLVHLGGNLVVRLCMATSEEFSSESDDDDVSENNEAADSSEIVRYSRGLQRNQG